MVNVALVLSVAYAVTVSVSSAGAVAVEASDAAPSPVAFTARTWKLVAGGIGQTGDRVTQRRSS